MEPNYEKILKCKTDHYGETKAAYQFAAEEYARQYHEWMLSRKVVCELPILDGLPENMPLYKDSGLWQMRSDDMEDVIIQQSGNESDASFLQRCREVQVEMLRKLLSDL